MATLDKVFKEASVKKARWGLAISLTPSLGAPAAGGAAPRSRAAPLRRHAPPPPAASPPPPAPQLFKDLLILAQYVGRRVRRRGARGAAAGSIRRARARALRLGPHSRRPRRRPFHLPPFPSHPSHHQRSKATRAC
jgi:hypothetical protein